MTTICGFKYSEEEEEEEEEEDGAQRRCDLHTNDLSLWKVKENISLARTYSLLKFCLFLSNQTPLCIV